MVIKHHMYCFDESYMNKKIEKNSISMMDTAIIEEEPRYFIVEYYLV